MKKMAWLLLALPWGCDYDDDSLTRWYVDPIYGSDYYGDGTSYYPFRTITHAISHADKNDVLFLARGTYSSSTGESFPIVVRSDVTVEGDPGAKGKGSTVTLVQGGGSFSSTGGSVNATFILGSGSKLRGVVVTNNNSGGVGVVIDSVTATLEFCTVEFNLADGVRVYGAGSSSLSNNVITNSGGDGIVTFHTSTPVLRQNQILNNSDDGVEARDTSAPNLGDSSGNGANKLQGNSSVGLLNNTSATTIQAIGNTWKGGVQSATGTSGGDGTYPGSLGSSLISGVVSETPLNNFAILSSAAKVQF